MSATKSQLELTKSSSASSAAASRALEWLWQRLRDVPRPRILDCGPILQTTLNVLLRRSSKVYAVDLLTPAGQEDSPLWSRAGKKPVFLVQEFLAQIPAIPLESLSAIFCWHLLDLLPREALPAVVERLCSYLQPGGVLFSVLREPYLAKGAETCWWLESLTTLGAGGDYRKPFLYPSLTNREMERLMPGGNVKTFLTRSGRREVLGVK